MSVSGTTSILAELISSAGWSVITARSNARAVELAEAHGGDLLLLDAAALEPDQTRRLETIPRCGLVLVGRAATPELGRRHDAIGLIPRPYASAEAMQVLRDAVERARGPISGRTSARPLSPMHEPPPQGADVRLVTPGPGDAANGCTMVRAGVIPPSANDESDLIVVVGMSDEMLTTVAAEVGEMGRVVRVNEIHRAVELGALAYPKAIIAIGERGASSSALGAFVRRIAALSDAPLVVIADALAPDARLAALDAGAADVLSSPFDAEELRIRVRRAVGHAPAFERALHGPCGIELDQGARTVQVGGEPLHLAKLQYEILLQLLVHRGQVVRTSSLAKAVWGVESASDYNFVQARVSKLRGRLGGLGAGSAIQTIRGIGYLVA
jgi:DNA-binding response OmpR family regulator